jgi:hypothetical protein
MSETVPPDKGKPVFLWDKIVFSGSIIGLVALLLLSVYKNHVNKELILENAKLKEEAAIKDAIIHAQQLSIDSLKRK